MDVASAPSITYLTNLEAKAAVWIVADPRPEHVRAITWLNESSSASFFLLKVEAVKIGDSPPAPLLTLIVGPSEEAREVGETKKEMAERYLIRERFWTALLTAAKEKTKLHANISPARDSWLSAGAGKAGLGYVYAITQHVSRVELYINRGLGTTEENKAIFDSLAARKEEIERVFGEPLDWQRQEGRQQCRICKEFTGGYRDDESEWPVISERMIDAMIRLEKAMRPHVKGLDL